jgi:transcriptional regulator NrdR family protein
MIPIVIKRDGTKEKFSVINIAKVATASGLTPDQARQLAQGLLTWVENVGKPEVSSLEIRDKMLEELLKINQNAAELYTWYEQSKDAK